MNLSSTTMEEFRKKFTDTVQDEPESFLAVNVFFTSCIFFIQ